MFVESPPTNDVTASPVANEKMIHQTRKLVDETVKLSDLTHRLFWVTLVLAIFAIIRYAGMVLDFCNYN